MKAAIYLRISDDKEGMGLGVERQEQDSRSLAESKGWDVVSVHTDNDISASGKRRRPGWEALLGDIEAGRIGAVVAYSSSRMYRRPADLQRLVDLSKTRDLEIATVASGRIDLTTADGRMLAGILAAVDQGEIERTSERIRRKLETNRAEGKHHGGARSFGTDVVPHPSGSGKVAVVNAAEAALIQEAAVAVLNGQSLGTVVRRWNDQGWTTTRGSAWTRTQVRRTLSRDLEGILSRPDQDALLSLFAPRGGRRRAPRYLLTGVLRCSVCDGPMRAWKSDGRRVYQCWVKGDHMLSVNALKAEESVLAWCSQKQLGSLRGLISPDDPILKERRDVNADLAALSQGDYPLSFKLPEVERLKVKLAGLDAALADQLPPEDVAAEHQTIGAVVRDWGLGGEGATPMTQSPMTRAYVESLVDHVSCRPGKRGRGSVVADRLTVVFRPNVIDYQEPALPAIQEVIGRDPRH